MDKQVAERQFTESDVEQFAELSGDYNPLHMDAEYAESARFGERIVHGTLVEGVISAALASFEGDVIYRSKSVDFVKPVYIGDTVRAVVEIEASDGNTHECSVEVTVDGETVIGGMATVLIE